MVGGALFRCCCCCVFAKFNEAFTSLFVVELAIKMGLLGPVGYFSDGFNVFDFIITLLGLIETTIEVRCKGFGGATKSKTTSTDSSQLTIVFGEYANFSPS